MVRRVNKPVASKATSPRLPDPSIAGPVRPAPAAAEPAATTTRGGSEAALKYQIDLWQRSVLFLDILRERANNMLAHEQAGLPPLLDFETETILDARGFKRPANYALLRITGSGKDGAESCLDPDKCPVIVIDPRAGHGPGIGGFKEESEVGMARREGHPVYFVSFFPEPCPGQTLGDVLHALRRFVEEVSRRHDGTAPVLYGNCQAGWAAILLAADCEGLVGPVVINGSPLSYWAGENDVNPMRLAGGLTGGTWLARYLADLGNGSLDGAWLAQNFESLNRPTRCATRTTRSSPTSTANERGFWISSVGGPASTSCRARKSPRSSRICSSATSWNAARCASAMAASPISSVSATRS